MPDLATYVQAVLADEDKILMQEASDCLVAGANRAAYITIWLAAAESIRRKFVEASTRDGQAAAIVRQIQAREAQHKAIDGLLIDKAKEYGFVTDAERTRLRHLYEDRNVFGHPYEQRPSDQLVATAASEAVDIVLGRPVALREGFLSNQVSRLTGDTTFLSDDEATVAEYAQIVHGRSASDLRVWFVKKMWRALDSVFADPVLDRLQRRGVWFMRAFLLVDPAVFSVWDPVDDLPDHRKVIAGILADARLFPHLSAHASDIVVNVLVEQASGDPAFLNLMFDLSEAQILTPSQEETVLDTIATYPWNRISASGLPLRAYAGRLRDELRTYTWDRQNAAITALRNAGRDGIAALEPSMQEDLGRNVMQAAEGSAFAATNFLGSVYLTDEEWPPAFLAGLAKEPLISEAGEIRLKPREMPRALRTLLKLDDSDRNAVIDEILACIQGGAPRDPSMFRHQRPEIVTSVRRVAEHEGLERLAEVAAALEGVAVDDDDDSEE